LIEWTLTCLIGLSLFVSWPVSAFNQATKHSQTKIILVFGDSLSAGYGIKQSDSWPSLLQNKISNENLSYQVVNASVSGETTSGGLARFDEVIDRIQPSVVILELGANDGLRGLPIKEMQKNLQSMIDQAKKKKIKVLLVGMKIPPNYGIQYTKSFDQAYQVLSEQNKVPLVPFLLKDVALKSDLMQADGLHPNANGQPFLLDNIWSILKKIVK